MPYTWSEKYFNTLAIQPLLTPYLGILFFYPPDILKNTSVYSFENEHAYEIIRQFPKRFLYQCFNFRPDFKNWYSFYFNNYYQTTRYTYILNNIKNHEIIWSGFTNTLRRQIKSAENEFIVSVTDDYRIVFDLMKNSLIKKNVRWPLKEKMLADIDKELDSRQMRKILVCKNKDGSIISGVYLCFDKKMAFLLGIGMDKRQDSGNSVKLLIWESIKLASQFVNSFDFEGSMVPGVERLYRSFGAEMTPYFVIKKYKNKLVRLLLNFINK